MIASTHPRRASPPWGIALTFAALAAIAIALVVGLTGLTRDPVQGTDASGTTTLLGTFEPFQCGPNCVEGYIQAGARSVFVILPAHCSQPAAGTMTTVKARLDRTLGSGTYRAIGCTQP